MNLYRGLHRKSIFVSMLTIGVVAAIPAAAAPILTIDQSQTLGGAGLSTQNGESVAQGFVPTLDGLDAVELQLLPFFGLSTQLTLNIRSGTFNGPILGTSLLTTAPAGHNTVHFDFASTVPLTPRSLHFLEFMSTGLAIVGTQSNPYAAGSLLRGGTVINPGDDAHFVLGLHTAAAPVPEPGMLLLMGGGAALALRRRRSVRRRP